MAKTETRPCGHVWRNNDFECFDCLNARLRQYESALTQVLEGEFRYNMGNYETCAKNAARLALGDEFESASDTEQLSELRKILRSVREACNHRSIEMIGNEVVQLIPQIDAAIGEK